MSGFSFVHITDHHLLESEEAIRDGFCPGHALRRVMRHIAGTVADKADFILSTGDLVEPELDANYQCAVKLLGVNAPAALPGPQHVNVEGLQNFPMYFMPGNHDDRALMTKYLFPSTPQAPALYNFTFEHKGVQFVCMDWGPRSKAYLFPETQAFLAQALEAELPTVLVMHQHVKKIGSRWLDNFLADNLGEFWNTVLPHKDKLLAILSGHVHITYEDEYRGIPLLGLRSTAYMFAKTDEPLVILADAQYRYVHVHEGVLTSRVYTVNI